MRKTKHKVIDFYASHCGRSYQEVERKLDRDCFMDAKEALEWGLIDHILQKNTPV